MLYFRARFAYVRKTERGKYGSFSLPEGNNKKIREVEMLDRCYESVTSRLFLSCIRVIPKSLL